MKKHTTKLTKIMAILLVVGIALAVVGFVLKATNEMLVFIGYAGILIAVVSGVLIYKESGKTTTTRPGEIELPLGSTKNGHSGEVRISVLFSDVEDFKANRIPWLLSVDCFVHLYT